MRTQFGSDRLVLRYLLTDILDSKRAFCKSKTLSTFRKQQTPGISSSPSRFLLVSLSHPAKENIVCVS